MNDYLIPGLVLVNMVEAIILLARKQGNKRDRCEEHTELVSLIRETRDGIQEIRTDVRILQAMTRKVGEA